MTGFDLDFTAPSVIGVENMKVFHERAVAGKNQGKVD